MFKFYGIQLYNVSDDKLMNNYNNRWGQVVPSPKMVKHQYKNV